MNGGRARTLSADTVAHVPLLRAAPPAEFDGRDALDSLRHLHEAPAASAPRRRPRANTHLLWVEAALSCVLGLGLAWFSLGQYWAPLVALLGWLVLTYRDGAAETSPMRARLLAPVHHAVICSGAAATLLAAGVLGASSVSGVAVATATAGVVSGLVRVEQRWSRRPARVLLVGGADSVASLVERWQGSSEVAVAAVHIPGSSSRPERGRRMSRPVTVRTMAELPLAVIRHDIDVVVVDPGPHFTAEDLRSLTWSLEDSGTPIAVAGVLDKVAPHRLHPGRLGGQVMVEVQPGRPGWVARAWKMTLDRTVGTALLVVTAPFILALCLAVRMDSSGPAIFRQRRVGLDGKQFTMYKLRTMSVDAESRRGRLDYRRPGQMLFKLKLDPRVTRLGRTLRRTSLDELPQLLNVVKGDMSLIGPRPALPEECARYDDEARRRLHVKPGMTGLWQVSGRSDLDWKQSLALDLEYVDNSRVIDDLTIATRTVGAVFLGRGAY